MSCERRVSFSEDSLRSSRGSVSKKAPAATESTKTTVAVTITHYSEVDGVEFFTLVTKVFAGGSDGRSRQFTTRRRYSDFVALHQSTRKLYAAGGALPLRRSLPGKLLFHTDQALHERMRALQAYLNAALARSGDRLVAPLRDFLGATEILQAPSLPSETTPSEPTWVFSTALQAGKLLDSFPLSPLTTVQETVLGFEVCTGHASAAVMCEGRASCVDPEEWAALKAGWVQATRAAGCVKAAQSTNWLGIAALQPSPFVPEPGRPVILDKVPGRPELTGTAAKLLGPAVACFPRADTWRVRVQAGNTRDRTASFAVPRSALVSQPEPRSLGVSLAGLRAFALAHAELLEESTVSDALVSVVMPITAACQTSLAVALEAVGAVDPRTDKPFIGAPTVHVAVSPHCPLANLVSSLAAFDAADQDGEEPDAPTYFWLPLFACAHHASAAEQRAAHDVVIALGLRTCVVPPL